MVTFDEARANRRAAAAATPVEWWELAADLLDECKSLTDAVESKAIRYVKTPAGARKYGEPIGSPIRPDGPKIDYVRRGPKKRAVTATTQSGSSGSSTSGAPKWREDPDSSREQAFAPGVDPNKVDPKKLTENSIRSQLNELSRKKRTPEEEARSRALIAEMGRRGFPTKDPESSRERVDPKKDNGVSGLSDDDLDAAIRKLAKKRKLTAKDRELDLALVAEFSRREGARASAQARRLVGKSDADLAPVWDRLSNAVKVFAVVGDGDWDCQHMTDDDITLFLIKALSGRPSVEKLQQANAMLFEQVSRLADEDGEVKELTWDTDLEGKVRHVRTPEGARKYGKPIGSPITAADRAAAALRSAGGSRRTSGTAGTSGSSGGSTGPSATREAPRSPAAAPDTSSATPKRGESAPETGGKKPALTDAEYEKYTQEIESRIGEAVKAGKSTDATFSKDGGNTWEPERAKLHKAIIDELYAKNANVPNEGRGLIAGGLGGAGKSTTLASDTANIDQSKYMTVNPDDIKELMASKGMVPEVEGLSPMEASALIHEESSYIANALAQRAYAEKKNLIWDITMASKGSVEKRIGQMRSSGYDNLEAIFVDIPVETSVERALGRHRRGMENYRNGKGDGGRYVPPRFIRANESAEWSSANRGTYEALKSQFDRYQAYDNSGSGPVLIESSDRKSLEAMMAEVLARRAALEGKVG